MTIFFALKCSRVDTSMLKKAYIYIATTNYTRYLYHSVLILGSHGNTDLFVDSSSQTFFNLVTAHFLFTIVSFITDKLFQCHIII